MEQLTIFCHIYYFSFNISNCNSATIHALITIITTDSLKKATYTCKITE